MGTDCYYNLSQTQVLPERRAILEALITSAGQNTLGEDHLLLAVPALPAEMAADMRLEPLALLVIEPDGSLAFETEDLPWRNLSPGSMATFLSHFCQPGGIMLVKVDDEHWGYRLNGAGVIKRLAPALVDPDTKEFVEWLY
jgi:hypothetical protein